VLDAAVRAQRQSGFVVASLAYERASVLNANVPEHTV
jgi:hypothetical protein